MDRENKPLDTLVEIALKQDVKETISNHFTDDLIERMQKEAILQSSYTRIFSKQFWHILGASIVAIVVFLGLYWQLMLSEATVTTKAQTVLQAEMGITNTTVMPIISWILVGLGCFYLWYRAYVFLPSKK